MIRGLAIASGSIAVMASLSIFAAVPAGAAQSFSACYNDGCEKQERQASGNTGGGDRKEGRTSRDAGQGKAGGGGGGQGGASEGGGYRFAPGDRFSPSDRFTP